MRIVIYGLTITSAWGNGHATTYRSLVKALAARRHSVLFIEKDVEWYRNSRDMPAPEFCSVRLYTDWKAEESSLVDDARDADAIIVGSYFPDAIQATYALLNAGCGPVFFYDIDTPVTMNQLRAHAACQYLHAVLVPSYAVYLSFTGGPALRELEANFGSPWAVPFYCSVDPAIYRPTVTGEQYRCDLSYLGTYASDRQSKLMSLLNGAAERLPDLRFLVAGAQYPDEIQWAPNVRRMTHVAPPDHPSFYSSSRFTLNLTRGEMVAAGYSPSVRLFEASACGATILSDSWPGLEEFLTPGEEILLPRNAGEVIDILRNLSQPERARIGQRARDRILAGHTSEHRAIQLEEIVSTCQSRTHTAHPAVSQTSEAASPAAPL